MANSLKRANSPSAENLREQEDGLEDLDINQEVLRDVATIELPSRDGQPSRGADGSISLSEQRESSGANPGAILRNSAIQPLQFHHMTHAQFLERKARLDLLRRTSPNGSPSDREGARSVSKAEHDSVSNPAASMRSG